MLVQKKKCRAVMRYSDIITAHGAKVAANRAGLAIQETVSILMRGMIKLIMCIDIHTRLCYNARVETEG